MKAISINAYEIENDDGETMVFMTPKEFDFIKKQNDLKDKEIERLNNDIKVLLKENENKEKVIKAQDNIIKEVREYINTDKNCIPKHIKDYINNLLDKENNNEGN